MPPQSQRSPSSAGFPIALLVAAAEGLWRWLNEARAGRTR